MKCDLVLTLKTPMSRAGNLAINILNEVEKVTDFRIKITVWEQRISGYLEKLRGRVAVLGKLWKQKSPGKCVLSIYFLCN